MAGVDSESIHGHVGIALSLVGLLLELVCRPPRLKANIFQLSVLLTAVLYCKKTKSGRKKEKHAAAVKVDDEDSA